MAKKTNQPKKDESDQESEKNFSLDQQENENQEQIKEIPENADIPFEKYRNSFSVFNNSKKIKQLRTYTKIKSEQSLNEIKSDLIWLLNQNAQSPNVAVQSKQNSIIPQQHAFVSRVPPNSTIFIHIFKVDNKRCNIKALNPSGYVLAYFTDIKLIKKFHKLYKFLKNMGTQTFFVIYDEISALTQQASFIKKLSDYAKDFCYYCKIDSSMLPFKFNSINIEEDNLIDVKKGPKQKPTYVWVQNGFFWFFSEIFIKQDTETSVICQKLRKVQLDVENSNEITLIRSITDNHRRFITECMLINYGKSQRFQSQNEIIESFLEVINQNGTKTQKKDPAKFGNPDCHFAQLMKVCKECVFCSKQINKMNELFGDSSADDQKSNQRRISREKNDQDIGSELDKKFKKGKKQTKIKKQTFSLKISKTKYRCEGCSAFNQKDVPLCLECFEEYHFQKQKTKKKNEKKNAKMAELRKQKRLQKLMEQKAKVKLQNPQNPSKEKQHNDQHQRNKKPASISPQIHKIQQIDMSSSENQESLSQPNLAELMQIKLIHSNSQLKSIVDQIEAQKKKFMESFKSLLKTKKTERFAFITAEYVKTKAFTWFGEEKK